MRVFFAAILITLLLPSLGHARDWKKDALDDIKAFKNAPSPPPEPKKTMQCKAAEMLALQCARNAGIAACTEETRILAKKCEL